MAKKPVDLHPPPRPAPARSDSRAIVEAILEAARQLPVDASVNAIADRAGVGIASLYRYFPGKEAIYAELARVGHVRIREAIAARLGVVNTLESAIRECVRLGTELPFEERHVVDHVHANIPFAWHKEEAVQIWNQIIDMVSIQLEHFIVGTPTQIRTRARMMAVLLRGAARTNNLVPRTGTSTEDEAALLEAALLACATAGLTRRRQAEPPGPV
ncbi:MAG: TetR/AcrR family transcriptional regulator [Myxococcota bacterium]